MKNFSSFNLLFCLFIMGTPMNTHANKKTFIALNEQGDFTDEELSELKPKFREWDQSRKKKLRRKYNNLPKKQKEKISKRIQRFKKLSPEKKKEVQKNFRRFVDLDDDRKKYYRKQFNDLKKLDKEERRQKRRELRKKLQSEKNSLE